MTERARIGVDIGGTFTDVVLEQGALRRTAKLLTTSTAPELAVLEGVSAATAAANLQPGDIGLIIHGTTLITNSLIERKGVVTAMVTTEGFRDTLEMGTESRFEQYDLTIEKPLPLIPRRRRFAVAERLNVRGDVLIPLDEAALDGIADRIAAAGVASVAICFLHAYANPAHELRARERLARRLPGLSFSLSSEVAPEIREYERFSTTCANAYVQPIVEHYLKRLLEQLATAGFACPVFLMLSGGGLTDVETARRFPIRLIESGPAGGVTLAAYVARQCGLDRVVAVDMGGTTAKLAMIDDGIPNTARSFEFGRVFRFKKGSGLPLKVPSVELVEIGAGGGSIAGVDHLGNLAVGPDSAGADPGPACYGRGGTQPTVTDANLLLGRISPSAFAGGSIALDVPGAKAALARAVGTPLALGEAAAASAMVEVVDEAMANAAREHAVECAKSLPGRTLIASGGSAPLHASRLADKLEIDRVLIPVGAGVASAIGFLRAPVAYEVTRSLLARLGVAAGKPAPFPAALVNRALDAMAAEANAVVARAAPGEARGERRLAYMRYVGQGHEIAVALPARALAPGDAGMLRDAYERAYLAQYGRIIPGVEIEIVGAALVVAAGTAAATGAATPPPAGPALPVGRRALVDPVTALAAEVPVYRREALAPGQRIAGPALVEENDTTTVIGAAFDATIDGFGYIRLERRPAGRTPAAGPSPTAGAAA